MTREKIVVSSGRFTIVKLSRSGFEARRKGASRLDKLVFSLCPAVPCPRRISSSREGVFHLSSPQERPSRGRKASPDRPSNEVDFLKSTPKRLPRHTSPFPPTFRRPSNQSSGRNRDERPTRRRTATPAGSTPAGSPGWDLLSGASRRPYGRRQRRGHSLHRRLDASPASPHV